MYDTILFDGTDIKVAGVRWIEAWDGALVAAGLRGDNVQIPNVDGEDWVAKPFDAYALGIGLVLTTAAIQNFNDAYRTLKRLVKPDGTVTLTRQLSYSTGNESHTALAEYVSGLEPALTGLGTGRMVLTMKILEGLWYGSAVTIGTGASTIAGDVRTRRMTVTFTSGTNPTLTNSTTGETLTWTGSPGGGGVVIDVEARTAMQGVTDVSSALSWSGDFPMTLHAGSQTLALSGGGSVSVAYQPAYL